MKNKPKYWILSLLSISGFIIFYNLQFKSLIFALDEKFSIKKMPSVIASKKRVSIMTMNAENLFDTEHDPGKLDFTYMPKSVKDKDPQIQRACDKMGYGKKSCLNNDWDEEKLRKKLNHLASAIIYNGAPEIILFQEVENIKILGRLMDTINARLKKSDGFYIETVLIEGPDRRGIDVALLSKLPLVIPPESYSVDWEKYGKPRDTRALLKATFLMPGKKKAVISVFAFHFPSQGLSTKYRAVSLEFLRNKMQEQKELLKRSGFEVIMVAGGDSNIIEKEYSLWNQYMNGYMVSKDFITKNDELVSGAKGTHNYKGEWSYLDVLIFPEEMKNTSWKVDHDSAHIANIWKVQWKENSKKEKIPNAFRYPDYSGVADHFPFIVDIYTN